MLQWSFFVLEPPGFANGGSIPPGTTRLNAPVELFLFWNHRALQENGAEFCNSTPGEKGGLVLGMGRVWLGFGEDVSGFDGNIFFVTIYDKEKFLIFTDFFPEPIG